MNIKDININKHFRRLIIAEANEQDFYDKVFPVPDRIREKSYIHIKWFEGGKLNVSHICLDRHLETKKNKAAIIFEGNEPNDWKVYTCYDMYREVNKFADVLKNLCVKKGDHPDIAFTQIGKII